MINESDNITYTSLYINYFNVIIRDGIYKIKKIFAHVPGIYNVQYIL